MVFKKPFCYGAQQCKVIMEGVDAISFVIGNEIPVEANNDQPPESSSSRSSAIDEPTELNEDSTLLITTLKKVASETNIEEIISGRKRLREEDIDVEDCVLTQEERLTLYAKCRDYFNQDAWTAVGRNSKDISGNAKDLIFPLYTEAQDEDFWLFYCPGQVLTLIQNSRDSTKLKGYWLDRIQAGNTYSLLNEVQEIKVKWIIKTDHGPLYYEKSLHVNDNGDKFELPDIFKTCIRATLQKYGFLRV